MAYPMMMPGVSPSGDYPPLGFPESFGGGLQAPPARGGMFGRVGRADPSVVSDGAGYGLPQLSGDVVAAGQAPTRSPSWLNGGKFGWKDGLALTIGAIGDALQQAGGGQGTFMPFVMANRKRQQDWAEDVARRKADRDEWVWKQQWTRDNPAASTAQPYRFEDNAGNQWEMGPDGKPRLIFTDRAPKQLVANGQLITSTNPYADAAPMQGGVIPQPGEIVDDPRIGNKGGAGSAAPLTFRR